MQFRHACLESIGYVLPAESISSDQIESRLEPLYQRLRLPSGTIGTDHRGLRTATVAASHVAQRQE